MRDTGPLGKESGPSRASVESREPSRQDRSEPNSCSASRRKRDPTPSSAHPGAGQGWRFGRSDCRCVRQCQEGHGGGSPHAPPLSLEPAPARPRAPRPVRRSSRADCVAEPPASPHGSRSTRAVCTIGLPSVRHDGLYLLAVLGAVLVGARRVRKTGVLVLAFTLGFASVEVAVHSVHHLGDPEGAASCQVLSASQHVAGAIASPSHLSAPPAVPVAPVSSGHDQILPARFSRPDEGRAPPATPSAA